MEARRADSGRIGAVEDIAEGDEVAARHESEPGGEVEWKPVEATFRRTGRILHFRDDELIRTTPGTGSVVAASVKSPHHWHSPTRSPHAGMTSTAGRCYLREALPGVFALGETPNAKQLQEWLQDRWLLNYTRDRPVTTAVPHQSK